MLTPQDLVERYRDIHRERMQGLPIVHPGLEVEAVGFAPWEEHDLGVLITPWFMNLVLLPHGPQYDELPQGETVEFRFPSGPCEFTVTRDEVLDPYLSAVLFRTVVDFPSQHFVREVAAEALASLLALPPVDEPKIGRREFLGGLRSS
jgi:[NiFe] hydrogenase assembly HybE family chaperone